MFVRRAENQQHADREGSRRRLPPRRAPPGREPSGASLSRVTTAEDVADEAVSLLHESFQYYLAIVQRLDGDGYLRVVAGAGPPAEEVGDFLAQEQPVEVGVNGRVARSGRPTMVNDTRLDSDYLARNPRTDPGSELSLPILVAGSIWGVMNLEQEERGAFAEEDLLLAHVVAGQVGATIHRCRLVSDSREPSSPPSASSPT